MPSVVAVVDTGPLLAAADERDPDIELPAPDDYTRIAELVEQHADFPLGGVEARQAAAWEGG